MHIFSHPTSAQFVGARQRHGAVSVYSHTLHGTVCVYSHTLHSTERERQRHCTAYVQSHTLHGTVYMYSHTLRRAVYVYSHLHIFHSHTLNRSGSCAHVNGCAQKALPKALLLLTLHFQEPPPPSAALLRRRQPGQVCVGGRVYMGIYL